MMMKRRKCFRIILRFNMMLWERFKAIPAITQSSTVWTFLRQQKKTFNKTKTWTNSRRIFKGIPKNFIKSPRNPLKRCWSETNRIDKNCWREQSTKTVSWWRRQKGFLWFICGDSGSFGVHFLAAVGLQAFLPLLMMLIRNVELVIWE